MPRPNIIFIMADDLGYGDLGCTGHPTIRTPHIDALGQRGLTLSDYHSNGPLCTPTRAALITGRYQQRAGLEGVIYVNGETRQTGLPPTENSIAKELRAAGYATALMGKWHLGYRTEFNPVHHGFDEFRGYVSGNVDYQSHVDNAGYADWWHNLELEPEEGYTTDLISQHAVRFIREHRDQPFFLYVAHECPHSPYQGRHDLADRVVGSRKHSYAGSRPDIANAYQEMIEAMDDGVGDIVATLRELSLEENTLVIFCSDNGPVAKVGSSGGLRGSKGSVYEGGHRVPCLAAWPGTIPAGARSGAEVWSMDWLPTFAALAGHPPAGPDPLDGVDVAPVLRQEGELPERTTFCRYRQRAMARRGRWKLMRDGEETLLFDLATDLAETTDRATEHPDLVQELAAALRAWEAELPTGDAIRTV